MIDNPLLNFAAYFGVCLAFWAATVRVYIAVTPYAEFALVRQGNLAAALSLAGTTLGLALPLASLAMHAVSVADLAVWALVALAAQVVLWNVLRRFLFADLKEAIEAGRTSVGLLVGALSFGLGLLNAACLTY